MFPEKKKQKQINQKKKIYKEKMRRAIADCSIKTVKGKWHKGLCRAKNEALR